LSYLVGCRVIGIDWVPFFIETAKSILQTSFPSLPVTFHCQEMQCSDFSNATVIYLYGTCLPDEEIALLTRRFESLPTSVRIITVSYPLSDYTKNGSRIDSGLRELSRSPDPILEPFSVYSSSFCTIKQFSASFPWGEGEIYLNSLSDSKETLSSQPVESQK